MIAVSDARFSRAREGRGRVFDASRLQGWRNSVAPTEVWLTEKLYSDHLIS